MQKLTFAIGKHVFEVCVIPWACLDDPRKVAEVDGRQIPVAERIRFGVSRERPGFLHVTDSPLLIRATLG